LRIPCEEVATSGAHYTSKTIALVHNSRERVYFPTGLIWPNIAGATDPLSRSLMVTLRKIPAALLIGAIALAACQSEAPPSPASAALPTLTGETVTTSSGLQYIEKVAGTGAAPVAGNFVAVHYTGALEDGTKFDSSLDRGDPLVFQLGRGQVIDGWDEGIASMKVGGQRRLIIPPELAYGESGAGGGVIPPNATLIFDVELVDIPNTAIEEVEIGSGEVAQFGDVVSVHYTGTLDDGTKFDSSLDRGQPIQFQLGRGQVIPGWEQGIMGMQVGGKRKLTIPPIMGYGAHGSGPIPPDATLHFDVELVEIQK
jgi:peptidylprolyl isomerase